MEGDYTYEKQRLHEGFGKVNLLKRLQNGTTSLSFYIFISTMDVYEE